MDRDELIEWYLEQKEQEFESVEDLDSERELIGKALTKLAKVSRRVLLLVQECRRQAYCVLRFRTTI